MELPEIINIKNPEWEQSLGELESNITSLYIDVELLGYDFLKRLINIENLYISSATNMYNIDFIRSLSRLKNIFIANSHIESLQPLIDILQLQSKLREKESDFMKSLKYKLKNVAIIGAEISDISCFNGIAQNELSELNLSRNKISDLEPLKALGIYYGNFSYNEIKTVNQNC